MAHQPALIDPAQAEQRYAEMLKEAALPRFTYAHHDPDMDELQLVWDHGFTLHVDLTRRDTKPFDDPNGPRSSASRTSAMTASRST